jgi:hypothetical protein
MTGAFGAWSSHKCPSLVQYAVLIHADTEVATTKAVPEYMLFNPYARQPRPPFFFKGMRDGCPLFPRRT